MKILPRLAMPILLDFSLSCLELCPLVLIVFTHDISASR